MKSNCGSKSTTYCDKILLSCRALKFYKYYKNMSMFFVHENHIILEISQDFYSSSLYIDIIQGLKPAAAAIRSKRVMYTRSVQGCVHLQHEQTTHWLRSDLKVMSGARVGEKASDTTWKNIPFQIVCIFVMGSWFFENIQWLPWHGSPFILVGQILHVMYSQGTKADQKLIWHFHLERFP